MYKNHKVQDEKQCRKIDVDSYIHVTGQNQHGFGNTIYCGILHFLNCLYVPHTNAIMVNIWGCALPLQMGRYFLEIYISVILYMATYLLVIQKLSQTIVDWFHMALIWGWTCQQSHRQQKHFLSGFDCQLSLPFTTSFLILKNDLMWKKYRCNDFVISKFFLLVCFLGCN